MELEAVFEFFHENALSTQLSQRFVLETVCCGLQDFELRLDACFFQRFSHELGLPQSEFASSGC